MSSRRPSVAESAEPVGVARAPVYLYYLYLGMYRVGQKKCNTFQR